MPDIPVSVPVFTTLQDDIDFVLAEHQNTPNDEITALATLLGMPGVAQSHVVSFLNFLQNGIFGCGIKYSTTSAVIVQPGQIMVSNAGGTVRKLRSKSTDSSLTASDLDTGVAFTNSAAHYIYATGDTGTTSPVYKISTNASTPSGMTHYRRIGGFYVDGSGNIIFVWSDNRPEQKPGDVIYERTIESAANDSAGSTIPFDNTKPQTASEGAEHTDLQMVIVPTSTTDIIEIEMVLHLNNAAGTGIGYVAKNSDADALFTSNNAGTRGAVVVRGSYVPGAVTPITFKAFFGASAGTAYLNSDGGTGLFNGTKFSYLKIKVKKGALSA